MLTNKPVIIGDCTLYLGDCIEVLRTIPDSSVQCCVTSPPYYGLRDYGTAGQIGLEETPEAYVAKLVDVFREVRRVLRDDGVLWLNLGDSYAGNNSIGRNDAGRNFTGGGGNILGSGNPGEQGFIKKETGLKPKDLVGIPWRVAFALQADGWWLRQDIIWAKPNPMPESVTDRCTKSHEYIFLLTKSARYYYDAEAVKEAAVDQESYTGWRKRNAPTMAKHDIKHLKNAGSILEDGTLKSGMRYPLRNLRDVWTITTKPYREAHFATFPIEIPERCIKAGSKEGDAILDPFSGAGTTGVAAAKLGRAYIGIDLNPDYIEMSRKRIEEVTRQGRLGI
jgi:DNA modification methylase